MKYILLFFIIFCFFSSSFYCLEFASFTNSYLQTNIAPLQPLIFDTFLGGTTTISSSIGLPSISPANGTIINLSLIGIYIIHFSTRWDLDGSFSMLSGSDILSMKQMNRTIFGSQIYNSLIIGNINLVTTSTNWKIAIAASSGNLFNGTITSTNTTDTSIRPTVFLNIYKLPNPILFNDTLRVAKDGNDMSCDPCLTISAALTIASTTSISKAIWIFPGTYEESITIPAGITVRGLNSQAVIIQRENVISDTDLVTFTSNNRLEDVTLRLTSQNHVNLRAVVYPGSSLLTCNLRTLRITVDNSNASTTETSNITGIHITGTGSAGLQVTNIRATVIVVNSTGNGNKVGILLDTNNNSFSIRDTIVRVIDGSGISNGTFLGAQTNNNGSVFTARTSSLFGTTADISQTLGMIKLGSTLLESSNANGLGFDLLIYPTVIIFADPGDLPNSQTRYMRPGTGTSSLNEIKIRIERDCVIMFLTIRCINAPGAGNTDTFTIRRNGIDTSVTLTLSDTNTSATSNGVSQHFSKGDDLSLKAVFSASATSDIVINVSIY